MRRGELETLILGALQQNLMQPHLVEEFVRGYHGQINSARRDQETERSLASRQLAEVDRKLQHLLDALSEGIRAPGLQGKLDQLEAELRRLGSLLRQPAPPPVRLHPNLAELYRRQIKGLHRALAHPATRDEAFAILRD